MGYYIKIVKSTAFIPAENLGDAYKRMCDLNTTHHDKKYGGTWRGGKRVETFFSWMSPNYPDELFTAQEILEELGFETNFREDGALEIVGYDSKQGQEELFLESIRDLAYGRIDWVGEDDRIWVNEFNEIQ